MSHSEIVNFARDMERRCDVRIVDESQLNWIAAWTYRRMKKQYQKHIDRLRDELRPCCLCAGDVCFVVLPFELGTTELTPQYQEDVITHECQHAFDVRGYPKSSLNWAKCYVMNQTFRAHAEGGPNTAEAELQYWRSGQYDLPKLSANQYLIWKESAARVFTEGCTTRREAVLAQGENWRPTQPAARHAIEILKSFGYDGRSS